jgi:solute carrier family 6 dopamine transporter-like protein 3
MMGIYAYQPLEISRTNDTYAYPLWANILGWVVAASSCICIPIVAVYNLYMTKGTFMEVIQILKFDFFKFQFDFNFFLNF